MTAYITVKGVSVRCPRKNHTLLPYVLAYARNLFDVVVITDDDELVSIAKEYGVEVYKDKNTHKISEFHAIYGYLAEQGKLDKDEEFVILPVTQPLRNEYSMKTVRDLDMTEYDVVTTYTVVSNRSIFLLNEDNTFKVDSYNRKGCMCKEEKMADGSMYRMRNTFLRDIVESGDTNHAFWHSRIMFVENTHPMFLDVDTPRDLEIFNIIRER
jgi:CMP-N-acetylneuraminic acid synthetase